MEKFIIYQTKRNADMTEGRGPMVNDLAFKKKEHAEEYINTKAGVMGRRMKWSEERHGDWGVFPVEVLCCSVIDEKKRIEHIRKCAIEKLSDEEITALGLD